ncbi:MAG: hypothetical protein KGJ09_04320 [Candidatus Omnitrophica bacterium]|nr:hypothetical protein [Candidatus Omnitrophota bacterium]MDE2213806.1 hypothetical protein [Candidatus Omnitrophota bacterium]MDE2230617.1 hypothetical protein [Candidatus Omnitrophota bacterium]
MPTKRNPPLNEVSADIRNKLQAAITALEIIEREKEVPMAMVYLALRDLRKVLELIDGIIMRGQELL